LYKKYFEYFKNNKNIYLDSASTSQKPYEVIESVNEYYEKYCSNTHRSNFGNANRATTEFENARKTVKEFINARDTKEIIFAKGVTESLNFIASSFVKDRFDTVIISSLEHHSNIVPWHMQGRSLHNGLEVVDCDENQTFDIEHFERLLQENKNAFVSITHVSNAFGKIKNIIQLAHKYGAFVMIDGAQSLAHFPVDVQDLDVDFYAISAHKTYGPTGVGVIYIKKERLEDVKPYQVGGATIRDVTYDRSILLDSPFKYEAGTQNIAGVIGFASALKFMNKMKYENLMTYETNIYEYLYEKLNEINGIILYTDSINCIGSLSFNIQGLSADDIGILLDKMDISIRCGHHCAQPIMKKWGINGTARVGVSMYNNEEDIDKFIKALNRAIDILEN